MPTIFQTTGLLKQSAVKDEKECTFSSHKFVTTMYINLHSATAMDKASKVQ
jgi:hypothetical protein